MHIQSQKRRRIAVDFHCHTTYSRDSLLSPRQLIDVCIGKRIDRVVVTDHNTIEGAIRCKALFNDLVVVGEEIMTTQGELLAIYVKEAVPSGLTPAETIVRLRDQGAFISVSHPFDTTRQGHWKREALIDVAPHIDAIETFNSRCLLRRFNKEARDFAREYKLSETYGSDAHSKNEIGRGLLSLPPFDDAESLKTALKNASELRAEMSSPAVHFTSRVAVCRDMLKRNILDRFLRRYRKNGNGREYRGNFDNKV